MTIQTLKHQVVNLAVHGVLLLIVAMAGRLPAAETLSHTDRVVPDNGAKARLMAELKSLPHRILFESYVDNNWDLFIINADGTGRTNLTRTPKIHELYPQASPDGTRICFLADVPDGKDTIRSVYVMNADGTDRVLVAKKSRQPCWSPDGKTIAFLKQEFSRFHVIDFASKGLFFYDVQTRKIRKHPNDGIYHLYNPSWTSDGKWIVSTVHGGMGYSHAILAIEVSGMKVFNLGIHGCRPCVSPDGKRLAWGSDDHTISVGDLQIGDSSGSVVNIIAAAHDKKMHLYHVDFSPDGKYITYSVGPGGRKRANGPGTHTSVAEVVGVRADWDLFLTRSNGKDGPIQLTHNAHLSNKESDWLPVTPKSAP